MPELIRPRWAAPSSVRAVSTTRQGGVSLAPYDSFNLASHVGDAQDAVRANREQLLESLVLPAKPCWLNQVHGTTVTVLDGENKVLPEADAAVAFEIGQVCAVMTADCLPVLFCDRAGTRVAAAHAGWRGLASGVLEATVATLDADPGELLAWLGPAIGPQAFEVGEEVREAFLAHDPGCGGAFVVARPGHWLADLYTLARRRLQSLGVGHITGGGECTYQDDGRFFSYRRDKNTGRMASLIWLAEH